MATMTILLHTCTINDFSNANNGNDDGDDNMTLVLLLLK